MNGGAMEAVDLLTGGDSIRAHLAKHQPVDAHAHMGVAPCDATLIGVGSRADFADGFFNRLKEYRLARKIRNRRRTEFVQSRIMATDIIEVENRLPVSYYAR